MINRLLCLFSVMSISLLHADGIEHDSIFIENIINESSSLKFSSNGEKIIFIAEKFLGTPYRGGTLDVNPDEVLVTRIDSLDCTTFVETVLALYLVSEKECTRYEDYCSALKFIRYRDGIIDGYHSRLHYISDWIHNNDMKGLMSEVTRNSEFSERTFSINYMTEHSESYSHLRDNKSSVLKMREVERYWSNYHMPYIPKEKLNLDRTSIDVRDGDVLVLTTNIDGLDVVHMGFAVWMNNHLHLLHASSLEKKVILDDTSLYDYLKVRSKHTGIRVVRMK